MVGIYKITSPSGKIYIGQSTDIFYRFSYYKRLNCRQQKKLYASLKKYGVENHSFDVVINCDVLQLNELERYYQELYNCTGKDGLNLRLTKANDRVGTFSEETKLKMSLAQIGKKGSQQKIEKCRQRMLGKESTFKGKKHSEKAIKLISEKQIGNNKRSKYVLDLETGVFYRSVVELANLYNINSYTLRNKLNGFRFNNTKYVYA